MAPAGVQTLTSLTRKAETVKQVRKEELHLGDWLLVNTNNSRYLIRPLRDGFYSVSGGWFDKNKLSPFKTRITGCTWGGSAVKIDIVAALGRHVEFGNRVVTSAVRSFTVYHCWGGNSRN